MTRTGLIVSSLANRPTRTGLTLVSLAVAYLLFMLLQAVGTAFSGGGPVDGVQRVMVEAKYSMTDNLPLSYVRQIEELAGVAAVTQMVWFGSFFRDPQNGFAASPVNHEVIFDVFPELIVSEEAKSRFAGSRRAVIAEAGLAERFGWKVGDIVPLRAEIWPRDDGTWDWEFELAGVYERPQDGRMQPWLFLRWDYFNESVMDWVKNQVGWILLRVETGTDPNVVISAVDALYENSSDPTKSLSEDEFTRQFANQIGDVASIATAILGAVFFTILLLTANTAAMSYRESIPDLAVMKTLGFRDTDVSLLVFAESVGLFIAGAVVGILLAFALEPMLVRNLAAATGNINMSAADAVVGLVSAAVLGSLAALHPTWSAHVLPIVESLRETEA